MALASAFSSVTQLILIGEVMARTRFSEMDCAIAQSLEQIGDWWTLLIVRDAFNGVCTFTQLHESLGIARNILTERLNHLVKHGILIWVRARPGAKRHVYALSDKGKSLLPLMVFLIQWGNRWVFKGDGALDILDMRDGTSIRPPAVLAADGRTLSIEDLRFQSPWGKEKTRCSVPASGGSD